MVLDQYWVPEYTAKDWPPAGLCTTDYMKEESTSKQGQVS